MPVALVFQHPSNSTTQVPQLLVNGAECEPLLHKDKELLLHHADDMLRGIRISMELAGCSRKPSSASRTNITA